MCVVRGARAAMMWVWLKVERNIRYYIKSFIEVHKHITSWHKWISWCTSESNSEHRWFEMCFLCYARLPQAIEASEAVGASFCFGFIDQQNIFLASDTTQKYLTSDVWLSVVTGVMVIALMSFIWAVVFQRRNSWVHPEK